MLYTMFYQNILPIGSLYTLLTLFVIYWIDKIKFIRYRSYGRKLSAQIAFDMIELIEWMVITYGISIFMFDNLVQQYVNSYIFPGIHVKEGEELEDPAIKLD